MLELVGELSDGALLTTPLGYLDFALNLIKAGAEKAGKRPSAIDIGNWLPFAIDESSDRAKEMVKIDVCFMVADSPDIVHEKIGIKLDEVEAVRKALRLGIKEATKKVTSDMVDSFAIAGTLDECEEKIGEYVNAGVTQVILASPFGVNQVDVIKRIGKTTIPKFR